MNGSYGDIIGAKKAMSVKKIIIISPPKAGLFLINLFQKSFNCLALLLPFGGLFVSGG